MNNYIEMQTGITQITDFANQYASEIGIKISSVTFDDGRPLGYSDIHILGLQSKGKTAHTKLNHEEIEDYPGSAGNELTKVKIRNAIKRLQVLVSM